MPAYKIRFFELMTILHRHGSDAIELVKDYHAIYLTETIDEDNDLHNDDKWMKSLQNAVLFLTLSPYGSEQQDLLYRISEDSNLDKMPPFK